MPITRPQNSTEEREMLELALAMSKADVVTRPSQYKEGQDQSRSARPQARPSQQEVAQKRCAGCQNPLVPPGYRGPMEFAVVGNMTFHPQCCKCAVCGDVCQGQLALVEGKVHCRRCGIARHTPMCDCCKGRMPAQGNRVEYIPNEFWKEKYCKRHKTDSSVRCTSCARIRPADSNDVAPIGDGRSICLDCLGTIVPDRNAALPLYKAIMNFYASKGMKHSEEPPLLLVEDQALNEYRDRESGQGVPGGPATHTRGLCLCEAYETIRVASVVRGASGELSSQRSNVPLHRTRHVVVTAILVLAGMPWLLTGAVLAHELMHAWLKMNKFPRLNLKVEEGLCQLMAYLWLEAQPTPQGAFEARLASYIGHSIRTDRSDVYGDGFRDALAAFQQHGLQNVLQHVRLTRELP